MANNHLVDGLESHISRYNETIIFKHKTCKICGGNEFIVFDGLYVCCKRCGVVADTLSFQTSDINKANPMGFNFHKKNINAKSKKIKKKELDLKCHNKKQKRR